MSNEGVGRKVDGVTATRRLVRVDLVDPRGRPPARPPRQPGDRLTGDVDRTDQIEAGSC